MRRAVVVPAQASGRGLAAALLTGAIAGPLPAPRCPHVTRALRSV